MNNRKSILIAGINNYPENPHYKDIKGVIKSELLEYKGLIPEYDYKYINDYINLLHSKELTSKDLEKIHNLKPRLIKIVKTYDTSTDYTYDPNNDSENDEETPNEYMYLKYIKTLTRKNNQLNHYVDGLATKLEHKQKIIDTLLDMIKTMNETNL